LIAHGRARRRCEDPLIALDQAYRAGQSDEFLKPTAVLHQGKPVRLEEGDMIVFMNYRADRARQLSRSLTNPDFSGFERGTVPKLSAFISLTEYHAKYEFPVAFPPEALTNVFGQYISDLGLRQLRIAETEKYAHVTFFFNGGEERAFEGEHRILVPSAHVATYDRKPEMSARQITDKLVRAIKGKEYHAIICNYANADMVGHSGDLGATVKAVEAIDACLRRLLAACRNGGCEMIVTADHGNADEMFVEQHGKRRARTSHTCNPVPFVIAGAGATDSAGAGATDSAGDAFEFAEVESPGLANVAATVFNLLGYRAPDDYAPSLIDFPGEPRSRRTIHRGAVLDLGLETVRLPNREILALEIVRHPGGAVVAAQDQRGRVALIRQFRHAAGGWIWEFPAGLLEPGESPLDAAKRELREETGCTAAAAWQSLGATLTTPGFCTERLHLFLAINRHPSPVIRLHPQ